jgi:hypothetical protein
MLFIRILQSIARARCPGLLCDPSGIPLSPSQARPGLPHPMTATRRLATEQAAPRRPRQLGHSQMSRQEEDQQSSDASLPEPRQEQLQRKQNGACELLPLANAGSGFVLTNGECFEYRAISMSFTPWTCVCRLVSFDRPALVPGGGQTPLGGGSAGEGPAGPPEGRLCIGGQPIRRPILCSLDTSDPSRRYISPSCVTEPETRRWMSRVGCETWVWSATRRHSARMTSGPTTCAISPPKIWRRLELPP